MQNNFRKIALEVQALDDSNIVKVAGTIKNVLNWFKGFGDPEFKQKLQELQSISPEIKDLVDQVSVLITRLNKSIENTDPKTFGQALEAVKPMISELSSKLEVLDDKASDVISETPVDSVIDTSGKNVAVDTFRNLERNWYKDKGLMSQMKSFLPENLDVPIGRHINANIRDFKWFQQFQPNNIRISDNLSDWIIDAISKVVYDAGNLKSQDLNSIISYLRNNKYVILNQLREGVMNGILRSYTFPSSGQPNKMLFVVDAGIVQVPGLGYDIQFPTVIMRDKFTTLNPIKELEVENVKNVRAIRDYSFTPPEELKKEVESENTEEKIAYRTNLLEKFALAVTSDTWAREIIIKAFPKVMGRQPTEGEIQAVQAVARLETGYGNGWKEAGRGSNNWGAIQCGSSCKVNGKCDLSKSFEHRDSTPQDDGTTKWYVTCFKKYPTPEDGAADLIATLFKSDRKSTKGGQGTRGERLSAAVANGDLKGFSEAMYDTVYYEGFGKTKEERVANHMKAMNKALNDISKNTQVEIAMSDKLKPAATPVIPFTANDANELMSVLFASGPIEKIVKRAIYEQKLPKTSVLIVVGSNDLELYNRLRFAKILTSALRIELDAEVSLHNEKNRIEVHADIYGSEEAVNEAVYGLSEGVAEAFELNIGSKIASTVICNTKSELKLVTSEVMEDNFRKYAFASASK